MFFPAVLRLAARGAVVGLMGAGMAACTSASLEDATPGPRITRTFPNLNVPMRAETDQFSPQESQSHVQALSSAQQRVAAEDAEAAATVSSADRLRELALNRGEDTLRQIEEESMSETQGR